MNNDLHNDINSADDGMYYVNPVGADEEIYVGGRSDEGSYGGAGAVRVKPGADRAVKFIFKVIIYALLAVLAYTVGFTARHSGGGNFFASCSENLFGMEQEEYDLIVTAVPRHSGYEAIKDRTAYSSLDSDKQRSAYEAIEASIFQITAVPFDKGGYRMTRAFIPALSSEEVFMVKEAVIADHPEAFWINGDYEYGHNLHDGGYVTLISAYSHDEILLRKELLEQSVARVLRDVPGDLSEFDRELAVHDWLVGNADYDTAAAEQSEKYSDAATVYGALVDCKALCSGYSKAAKLLLNRLGISCATVNGVSKDVGHMWNIVRIEGEWYHLDMTWDDPVIYGPDGISGYDYFNVPDEYIRADHIIAENYDELIAAALIGKGTKQVALFNFDMPECTALKNNFYERRGVKVGELNDKGREIVAAALGKNCAEGEEDLYLCIPADMDGDVVNEWIYSALFDGRNIVNRRSGGRKIGNMTYMERSDKTVAHWRNVYCIKLTFFE